jgi:hypothetical protein
MQICRHDLIKVHSLNVGLDNEWGRWEAGRMKLLSLGVE